MTANLGGADRALRLVAGLLVAALGFALLAGAWAYAAIAIGAVLALTALIGFCPAYTLFGLDTCRRRIPGA